MQAEKFRRVHVRGYGYVRRGEFPAAFCRIQNQAESAQAERLRLVLMHGSDPISLPCFDISINIKICQWYGSEGHIHFVIYCICFLFGMVRGKLLQGVGKTKTTPVNGVVEMQFGGS